jgi:hypothetical protein
MFDLTGKTFGRLTVLREQGRMERQVAWLCQCECGTHHIVRSRSLRTGETRSCGCLSKELLSTRNTTFLVRHGAMTGRGHWPEYRVWRGMLNRCYNENDKKYYLYGGRGIAVCDRWQYGENGTHPFMCFLIDVGWRPADKQSIDRCPDKNGNYEPNNTRWATHSEQNSNRRTYTRRRKVETAKCPTPTLPPSQT